MNALNDINKELLSSCSHCGKCRNNCEVLQAPDLDIGEIEDAYSQIIELSGNERLDAVRACVSEKPSLYNALRQCCFCGHCTSDCASHIAAPSVMRKWRQLFLDAGITNENDSKLVMVDNEWHIFSAYRAIYGVAYPEFVTLDGAAEYGPGWVDTLFFPGCSLVTYAPNVMCAIAKWLDDTGIKWAYSDSCCGSPLMSAGLFDRANSHRRGLVDKMLDAGITRMITVCPGCADEFREDLPDEIELVPLPEVLLSGAEQRITNGGESGFSPMQFDAVTFFDSCHDRDDVRNSQALRKLFAEHMPNTNQLEMDHNMQHTLCCGAGGAVGSYDPVITDTRVWRVINEAKATDADHLITMCPTCTYTIAQACLANPEAAIENYHYLEVLFDVKVDWKTVFGNLESMWTGEYGPWLNQTFFA